VDHRARAVGEDLDLDVSRPRDHRARHEACTSPKAASDSRRAAGTSSRASSSDRTTRMPFPPPPARPRSDWIAADTSPRPSSPRPSDRAGSCPALWVPAACSEGSGRSPIPSSR
jgi:hypothetical protein